MFFFHFWGIKKGRFFFGDNLKITEIFQIKKKLCDRLDEFITQCVLFNIEYERERKALHDRTLT